MNDSRVLLVILDGFGVAPQGEDNAITEAHMTYLESLKAKYPWTTLKAAGNAVGLPEGYQGNSEVGHFTIGSGRITFQSLEEIDRAIADGSFFTNEMFLEACKRVREGEKKALHLVGMISDEGVHSHIRHLFALMELAKSEGAFPIYIHGILDGRDVPERSAHKYIQMIQDKIVELGLDERLHEVGPQKAAIATLIGRYYAMDRDNNWDRTKVAYDLLVHGTGTRETDPIQAVEHAYAAGAETDYYVPAILLKEHGTLREGDALIFFNYRTDRSRQLTDAFVNKKFEHFEVAHGEMYVAAMGPYTDLAPVAFPAPVIFDNLGEVLSKAGVPQLRMAETEKYAHVTYFFNSQVEEPQPLEDRVLVDSPKTPSYADKPEMSARELTARLVEELAKEKYRFVAVNYANADLVGHSGELKATIECCKVLDECLSRVVPTALEHGYTVLLTADHGNAEDMVYDNGEPCPAHTKNDVIFLMITPGGASQKTKDTEELVVTTETTEVDQIKLKEGKGLQDIAPTVLNVLGLEKPWVMSGESLVAQ